MSKLIDLTEQRPAPTQPQPQPQRYRKQEWTSLVAAAEGKRSILVPDYDFSGRTFMRRDQLLNPRKTT